MLLTSVDRLIGVGAAIGILPVAVVSYMAASSGFWQTSAPIGGLRDFASQDSTLEGLRQTIASQGWAGFADLPLLVRALVALVLASVLGAVVAYHPRSQRTVDRVVEVEAQKAYVMYAAIGALTGIMVLRYGLVVGFVLFGIGGLIRFRSEVGSAPMTGRLIFVTLVGLACGLDLPHLAILATAFVFALIAVLDANVTYQITVKGLAVGSIEAALGAYRALLEREHCRVIGDRKHFSRGSVDLVFRAPHRVTRDRLDHVLATEIPADVRGALDWEAE